jgi:hypothetical protein
VSAISGTGCDPVDAELPADRLSVDLGLAHACDALERFAPAVLVCGARSPARRPAGLPSTAPSPMGCFSPVHQVPAVLAETLVCASGRRARPRRSREVTALEADASSQDGNVTALTTAAPD